MKSADIVRLDASAPAYPKLSSALWLMALLFLAANLYNIDRLIIGVLAEQIRGDLKVSEVQLSLLMGAAYSLLSAAAGVVLGFYVDRTNRARLIAFSLALWSLATLGGGLSTGFGGLFAARVLVGLGEAGLAPAAISLIADLFAPGQRGRAMSVYLIGATLGGALATIVPGLIVGANLHLMAPGVGLLKPWRVSFVLCGLVGLGVAVLMLTVREPARRRSAVAAPGDTGLAAKMQYLKAHASVLAPFLIGFGFFFMALMAVISWATAFLARHFALPLNRFSGLLGLTMLATGLAGYLLGGAFNDTPLLRSSARKLTLMAIGPLLALPGAFLVLAPSLPLAIAMIGVITFVAPLLTVINSALIQELFPNTMRGLGMGLSALATSVLALTGGPLLVAMATQHLFKRPDMVGYSIMVVAIPALLAGTVCYLFAVAGLRRRLAAGGAVVEGLRAAG